MGGGTGTSEPPRKKIRTEEFNLALPWGYELHSQKVKHFRDSNGFVLAGERDYKDPISGETVSVYHVYDHKAGSAVLVNVYDSRKQGERIVLTGTSSALESAIKKLNVLKQFVTEEITKEIRLERKG